MHTRLLRSLIAPALTVAALLLVFTACDTATTGDDTITLNDPANPTTVTYEFEYDPSTAVNGEIGVASIGTDNLGSIIGTYGFSRDDVVSARVTSITISRSAGTRSASSSKLYDYVEDIKLHLGGSESGPLIAPEQAVQSTLETNLNTADTDLTGTIQSGPAQAFMIIGVNNTSETQGFIEAEVDFRIEVQSN
ncbi:hypothetical protein CRI94_03875 [Longibacter salinarum]|uniref:Lipid/polyisoprenoid-binding YceI-like domain-containing protein n=1 Tax=Longibacter salinarum TaxID=1850348 RepID=A0A2A8CZP7_9BACT|nr:hypothetical protein [Longibacter salinarum]PEN14189.1 hypothetical protein CRI94_03875 [Longibacter salinarum]